jgi:flavin reductase (DIM6/NTAB) family NADH-FMN oxidoreductase RutF
MPVFLAAVRISRFTHEFIEDSDEFTVNVPGEGLDKTVNHCGEVSGREHDKLKECKLSLMKGKRVKVPAIRECKIHYECKVVHKLEVKPDIIPADVKTLLPQKDDYHTLCSGKILTVY